MYVHLAGINQNHYLQCFVIKLLEIQNNDRSNETEMIPTHEQGKVSYQMLVQLGQWTHSECMHGL